MKTLDQVAPGVPIESLPFSIDAPGMYYLTSTLTGTPSSVGIAIRSNNVTLDLKGFSLVGASGGGVRNGIYVSTLGRNNVVVRNGMVRDWTGDGVNLGFAANSRIEDIQAFNNAGSGIEAGLDNILERCQAAENLIGIDANANCVLRTCVASRNGKGIVAGVGATLEGCAASENTGDGFDLAAGSSLQGCTALANGEFGIHAASGSSLKGCTARYNVWSGFRLAGGTTASQCASSGNDQHGILADDRCNLIACAAYHNLGDGIRAGDGTTIRDCTAHLNRNDGIEVRASCRVVGNTLGNNGFITGTGAGIHATASGNHIRDNSMLDAPTGLDVDSADNVISGNRVQGNVANYELAQGNQLELLISEIPQSITWPAMVRLTGSMTGVSNQNGITISASQVTLDLGGHALIGAGAGSTDGIRVSGTRTNLVVRNGTVRDWGDDGIDAFSSLAGSFEDLRLMANGGDGLHTGDTNVAFRCVAVGNGGSGISLDDGCIIKDCLANRNGVDGVYGEDAAVVVHCTASANGRIGIHVPGNGSVITHCASLYNASNGVSVNAAGTVTENTCRENDGYGILTSSDGNILRNQCDGNSLSGFRVNSQDNRLDSNHATDNQGFGFEVGSLGNLIIRNSAAGNDLGGFTNVSGNAVGPILSYTATTTQPFANFDY